MEENYSSSWVFCLFLVLVCFLFCFSRMPFSLGNTSEVSFQTWGLYKQKTTGPELSSLCWRHQVQLEGVCIRTCKSAETQEDNSQYEDFETLNVQTALLDLSVLQDIRNCLELENNCANCKRSRLTALGFQFLYQPRRFSGIQLVPVLLAGVWVVHTLCKTSQLNAWLALHYYDVFKYRVALYKWTALLSSFPQIIGTLLKKFQISLQLNPSHWQPSLTTNDCFSGNGAGA